MARLIMERLGGAIDEVLSASEKAENASSLSALNADLSEKLRVAKSGWGERYVD